MKASGRGFSSSTIDVSFVSRVSDGFRLVNELEDRFNFVSLCSADRKQEVSKSKVCELSER